MSAWRLFTPGYGSLAWLIKDLINSQKKEPTQKLRQGEPFLPARATAYQKMDSLHIDRVGIQPWNKLRLQIAVDNSLMIQFTYS